MACVCVCVAIPFILDVKAGRPGSSEVPRNPLTRWDVSSTPANGIFLTKKLKNTGGRSHRVFHPPSFCGACLNFSREKDPAIPVPRRPRSRILCTNELELVVLHLCIIPVRVTTPRFELTSQRQRVSRLPTEPPGRPAKNKNKAKTTKRKRRRRKKK